MAPPLHERLRKMIPQKVKDVIPEGVKDRLRPPAWRDAPPAPYRVQEYSKGPRGELKFILGAPAKVYSQRMDGGTTVTEDSKGYQLPEPVMLPLGTEGKMISLGPDFVDMQFGDGQEAPRYRVPKADVVNIQPESERKISRHRRRLIEVTAADLRAR